MFNQSIANSMVKAGLLPSAAAREMVHQAESEHVSLFSLVARNQSIPGNILARFVARQLALPWVDLGNIRASISDDTQLEPYQLSLNILRQHEILPLSLHPETPTLAFFDPACVTFIEEVVQRSHAPLPLVIVAHDQLHQRLSPVKSLQEQDRPDDDRDLSGGDQSQSNDDQEAPVVRFIDRTICAAIDAGASDIHLEPGKNHYRIRFRCDGLLHEMESTALHLAPRISGRIKVMANLDITERRKPQDGRIQFDYRPGRQVGLRVSTVPVIWGEKIVIRIMNDEPEQLDCRNLGMDEQQTNAFLKALGRSQGMVLVTGPTGSGKSVTLYAALQHLNQRDRNIFTVEDPVEMTLAGANQVAINSAVELDFATALRAFLRQDPDIIMLGEIRDQETADISVKAAQTGHLVLSTLHTNSAADTVRRLLNMGVAHYNLSSALSLIVAQRLCRRLCEHCKMAVDINSKDGADRLLAAGMNAELVASATVFEALGCHACHKGYRGRVAIFELLPITGDIESLISAGASTIDIRQAAAQSGQITLRQAALQKVAAGETSLAEVERVC
ncbi:MAG TPA: type IV-A pilus assembly ATPase PilB [Pseudohongiella sp.]|nr:type IV-A pilus assembly ATPase PilB [Pseudohongiella sp.]|tara:strand:- start:169891 stop:171570 length:1680 start_codon:yes stop_codon:yes gene_type:complete